MSKKKHKKSSKLWLQEHINDPYVKKAKELGYRSRAAFKLIELQERDRIIRPGGQVVDLGAAPGSWSQMAAQWIGRTGKVYALDILPMDAMADVSFLLGDFTEDGVLTSLLDLVGEQKVDVVLSDMAPNMSGVVSVDQPRSMYLAELALDCAQKILKPKGVFVTKLFHGEGFDIYIKQLRVIYDKVNVRKPKASRSRSNEVYVVARNV